MKTLNTLKKRGVAVLLAVMMCVGMLNLTVFAANTANNNNTNSVADASTADTWKDYFTDDGYDKGVDAGFVWTDKSVAVAKDNGDGFEITYSALGSADVTTAVDLVLVLDISGSMGDPLGEVPAGGTVKVGETVYTVATGSPPRMYYLMEAVNEFMGKFMAQSAENRIAIVVYDSCAYELLPLDHYTLISGYSNYVTASRHHWQYWSTTGSQYASQVTTHCVNSKGEKVQNSVASWGNTNLMAGIGAGMDILNTAENLTVETSSGQLTRTPVMVVMTDGEANAYVTNETNWQTSSDVKMGPTAVSNATIPVANAQAGKSYLNGQDATLNPTDLTTGNSITPADNYGLTPGVRVFAGGMYHYYTKSSGALEAVRLATTAYASAYKTAVASHYGSSVTPLIYTIGYDITSGTEGYKTIDPKGANVENAYNDGYWDASSSGTGTPITTVFNTIYNGLSSGVNYPTTGNLTYTDELGDFMEIGSAINISVFDTTVAATKDNGWNISDNKTVINSLGQEVNLADAINISVTTNGAKRQVLTIEIDPEALPVYTYTTTAGSNSAEPITFTYNVNLSSAVLNSDGTINASAINKVDPNFINSHSDGDDGVYFHSNYYDSSSYKIGAQTTFVPSNDNEYYKENNAITSEKVGGGEDTKSDEYYYIDQTMREGLDTTIVWHGNDGLVSAPLPEVENVKDVLVNGVSVDGQIVNNGATLTYEIDYVNDTRETATVTITDTVPKNTTYVSNSAKVDSGNNAQINVNGNNITWTIDNVKPYEGGTVSFQVTLDDDAWNYDIDNTAHVNVVNKSNFTTDHDTNTTYNTTPHKDVFADENDATSNTNSIDGQWVQEGDTLVYRIDWRVPENAAEADEPVTVTVTDAAPAGTTLDQVYDNGVVDDDGTITWTIKTTAGKSGYVTFSVTVNEEGPTNIPNDALVKVSEHEAKTNQVLNRVPRDNEKTVTVDGEDWDGKGVDFGDTLHYSITWQNDSGDTNDVTITDKIPEGTDFVKFGNVTVQLTNTSDEIKTPTEIEDVTPVTPNPVDPDDDNTDDVTDPDDGDNTGDVTDPDDGDNTGDVTDPDDGDNIGDVTDPDDGDNTGDVTDPDDGDNTSDITDPDDGNNAGADIRTEASDEPSIPVARSFNARRSVATEPSPAAESAVSYTKVNNDGTLTWNFENVPDGAIITVEFDVTVTAQEEMTIENQAEISIGDNDPDVTNITKNPTDPRGILIITKDVVVEGAEQVEDRTYNFVVTAEDGTTVKTSITTEDGKGQVKIDDLVPGTYTVTEADVELNGYTWTYNVTGFGFVQAGTPATVNVTNTYTKHGELTIVKVVDGGGDTAKDQSYSFTVTGPNGYSETVSITGAGSKEIKDLEPGTYTVTEANAGISGYTWSVSVEGDGVVTAGGTAMVTFTNKYTIPTPTPTPTPTPSNPTYTSLTVNKVWTGDDEETRPDSIQVQLYRNSNVYGSAVTLSETNGWGHTWESLDDSYTWTVGEVDVPEGYTSSVSTSGSTVTITNTYEAEELEDPEVPLGPGPEQPDEEEELEDPDVPLGPAPDLPGDDPDPDEDLELPEPDVPLGPAPDLPDDGPDEEIELLDPDVPLAEMPDEEIPLMDLPDEDVPLASVPRTGDSSLLWYMLTAVSAAGLAVLTVFGRKKREDENP